MGRSSFALVPPDFRVMLTSPQEILPPQVQWPSVLGSPPLPSGAFAQYTEGCHASGPRRLHIQTSFAMQLRNWCFPGLYIVVCAERVGYLHTTLGLALLGLVHGDMHVIARSSTFSKL